MRPLVALLLLLASAVPVAAQDDSAAVWGLFTVLLLLFCCCGTICLSGVGLYVRATRRCSDARILRRNWLTHTHTRAHAHARARARLPAPLHAPHKRNVAQRHATRPLPFLHLAGALQGRGRRLPAATSGGRGMSAPLSVVPNHPDPTHTCVSPHKLDPFSRSGGAPREGAASAFVFFS